MSKVEIKRLDSVTSNDTTATALINDNFLAIQQAIENTLSRDGTTPNFMDADLDMNSYRIINSSDPTEDNDIVNLKWVKENIGGASQYATDAAASATKAATSAQQAAVSASNSLTIYNNVTATVEGFDDVVSEATQEFTTLADEKITNVEAAVEGFDTNVEEKLNSFNTNAEEKQSQVDASAESAAESANIALEAAEKASYGNIGDIKYTTRTDVPNGGAWCDGAEYTQAAFPDIYQMLVDGKISSTDYTTFNDSISTNGSCGLFALDTATTSFKVPLLKDVYIKAGDTPLAFGEESLPNITGTVGLVVSNIQDGAFTGIEEGTRATGQSAMYYRSTLDASLSSPTYQDGAKVNPDNVVYRAYVVLYASAAEASVAQAQEFINALGGKANVGLDNVAPAQTFKDMSMGWNMPDLSSGISRTLDTGYLAETDGLFFVQSAYNSTTITVYIADNASFDNAIQIVHNYMGVTVSAATTSANFYPVPKGMYYKVTSTSGGIGGLGELIFYPLKGADNA